MKTTALAALALSLAACPSEPKPKPAEPIAVKRPTPPPAPDVVSSAPDTPTPGPDVDEVVPDAGPREMEGVTGGFVVVRRSAWLYSKPEEGAPRGRDVYHDRYAHELTPYFAFRLVEDLGEWVAVAPLAYDVEHCHETPGQLRGLDLKLYVRKPDVAPVVKEKVHVEYPDGTSFTLAAGLAVERPEAGWVEVLSAGHQAKLQVPDDKLAGSYQTHTRLDASHGDEALIWRTVGRIGGRGRYQVQNGPMSAPPKRRSPHFDAYISKAELLKPRPQRQYVVDKVGEGAETRVTLKAKCTTYETMVPTAAIRPRDDVHTGETTAAILSSLAGGRSVTKDTALFWPDGTRAGFTPRVLPIANLSPASGGRRCFTLPLRSTGEDRSEPEHGLPLCAEEERVREGFADLLGGGDGAGADLADAFSDAATAETPPPLRLRLTSHEGAVPEKVARRTTVLLRRKLAACFRDAPTAIDLRIDARVEAGKVSRVTAKGASKKVLSCVEKRVKESRWPRREGPTSLRWQATREGGEKK